MFGLFYSCWNFTFPKGSLATGLGWRSSGEHCYRCVLGHCTTNLRLNMQNIFSLRSYRPSWNWLLMIALEASPFFASGPPSSNRLIFWGSLTSFTREGNLFLPTVLPEAKHTPCQGVNSDIITQRGLTESVSVILQLSEFFPVHWEEHGSTFSFLLLKMLFVLMPTHIW